MWLQWTKTDAEYVNGHSISAAFLISHLSFSLACSGALCKCKKHCEEQRFLWPDVVCVWENGKSLWKKTGFVKLSTEWERGEERWREKLPEGQTVRVNTEKFQIACFENPEGILWFKWPKKQLGLNS